MKKVIFVSALIATSFAWANGVEKGSGHKGNGCEWVYEDGQREYVCPIVSCQADNSELAASREARGMDCHYIPEYGTYEGSQCPKNYCSTYSGGGNGGGSGDGNFTN